MKTVLFACIHNAGRSQMAAAWFNVLANPGDAVGISAGTEPASQVHPIVLEAMLEVGIDISAVRPQLLSLELAQRSDLLITMGCGEACPVLPGLEREDWPLKDPKGQSLESVRGIRDEIQLLVKNLLVHLKITGTPAAQ
jgi:arsenate reductase (thioredoxin)